MRDVIFANWYFTSVMSTTYILQHAVVCWVTTGTHMDAEKINRPTQGATDENVFKLVESVLYEHGPVLLQYY
jgi:hypothetical protein